MNKPVTITLAALALAGSLALAAPASADEPSLAEVSQAVREGHVADAQNMMTQVLRDHPNSAKAHFVEAEVLARLGRNGEARGELARAEQIEPGLAFAKPQVVRELRAALDATPRSAGIAAPAPHDAFPWGAVLLLGGVGLLLFLVLRARNRPAPLAAGGMVPAGATPYGGSPYPGGPYGMAPAAPGIGSGILGGLATGAAVGAGMVAGEVLAENLLGGHHNAAAAQGAWSDLGPQVASGSDLGSDLGVSGGWDSGGDIAGGIGGDDWS